MTANIITNAAQMDKCVLKLRHMNIRQKIAIITPLDLINSPPFCPLNINFFLVILSFHLVISNECGKILILLFNARIATCLRVA